jgi:hypothetical protein
VFNLQKSIVKVEIPAPKRGLSRLEPYEGKLCAAERGVESSTESREIGGIFLGHPIHLKVKARGEKSMSEKQRTCEGV